LEILDLRDSTAKQNYATHGIYRFYGKLPPLVVKELIREAQPPIVDIMCGSGTVLVESSLAGKEALGLDVNPLCTLVSKVKATPMDTGRVEKNLRKLEAELSTIWASLRGQTVLDTPKKEPETAQLAERIPDTRAVERWFTPVARKELGLLKMHINKIDHPSTREFCLVAFAGIIRRSSIASPRAGKLFRVTDKPEEDIIELFLNKAHSMLDAIEDFSRRTEGIRYASVIRAEARHLPIQTGKTPFVFWHPPYFALYKYSAIYMLELDWLGVDRKGIRAGEIEEGYKTSDITKFDKYMADLDSVLRSVGRILGRRGTLCAVIADSSLRGEVLPVVDRFRGLANLAGFEVERMVERKIHFSQASYHPSSKLKVKRTEDIAVYLRKK
jgi:hypothetical protein